MTRIRRQDGGPAFWACVDQSGGLDSCWPWKMARSQNGYGRVGSFYAHRVAAREALGEGAPGLDVMHACDNRICCNPLHLSYGTRRQNMADAVKRGRHYSPFTRHGRSLHHLNPRGVAYRVEVPS